MFTGSAPGLDDPGDDAAPRTVRGEGLRTSVRIGLGDPLGLVVDVERDLLELVRVLLAVVRAEEEVEPAGQGDADVRLGPAAIAAICSVERGAFDDGCAHGRPRFLDLVLSVVLTVAVSRVLVG